MSSIRKLDSSGLLGDHRKSSSSPVDDRQVYPSEEVQNAASLQSSSKPPTRVSAGSGPSPETRADDSIVSAPSPQGTWEQNQRLGTPPMNENPSDKPTNLQAYMSEPRTSIENGQRTDEHSGSESHISEPPQQLREPSPFPQHYGFSSPGSSILLQVGSGLHSHPAQSYNLSFCLDDEDNRPNHYGEQQENIPGQDREGRHRPSSRD